MSYKIKEVLKQLYDSKPVSYLKSYGGELTLTIILLSIFGFLILRENIKSALPSLKKNWAKNRCNPIYMPLAGMVYKSDKNESNLTAIDNNFKGCIQNILETIVNDALAPIRYVLSTIGEAATSVSDSVQAGRAEINKVRTRIGDAAETTNGKILNVLIPFQKILIYSKSFLNKLKGVWATAFYTVVGSYYITKSVIFNIIELILTLVILVLVGMIAAMLLIPFAGEALAAPLIAFYWLIALPLATLIGVFNNYYKGAIPDAIPHW